MKHLLLSLLFVTSAQAGIPFTEELSDALTPVVSNTNYNLVKKLIRAVWNPSLVADHGSSTVDSGVHVLGPKLPAKAIITSSYAYVVTPPSGTGSGSTVAFKCEDSGNILTAVDLTAKAAGAVVSGNQYGPSTTSAAAAGMTASIASECNVSAVVAGASPTAGKVVLFVEYVVGE